LAQRLVGACVDLRGTADARDAARYVTSLVSQLVPAADGVSVHARRGDQLFTLGVYGYPHFGSTLTMTRRDDDRSPFWSSQTTWARTPAEVSALLRDTDPETADRFRRFETLVANTRHRSMVITPCLLQDEHLGCVAMDAWTRPSAFHRSDIVKLELIGQVTALALADASHATVFDTQGRTVRHPMRAETQARTPPRRSRTRRPGDHRRSDLRHPPDSRSESTRSCVWLPRAAATPRSPNACSSASTPSAPTAAT
jgi:hypothetical protein